jgi:hypothetical protein
LEAVRTLLTGTEADLPNNTAQQGHQTGRFNFLWRGCLKGEKIHRGKRKGRPKKLRKKQLVLRGSADYALTTTDYRVLAAVLLKRVQKIMATHRLQTLCDSATEESWYYADKVTELVQTGMVAARQKNQTQKIDLNLRTGILCKNKARKRTSGTLQELLGDKRTVLESVFTTLQANAQTYQLWSHRLETDGRAFFADFENHPAEWAAYLLFGERRFASIILSNRWQLKQGWVHGWLAGVRRLLDNHLPEQYWIYPHEHPDAPLPWTYAQSMGQPLTAPEFARACQQKIAEVDQLIEAFKGANRPITALGTFQKKLQRLQAAAALVVTVLFDPEDPLRLGRASLKQKAQKVDQALREKGGRPLNQNPRPSKYRSALVAILSLAAIGKNPALTHPESVNEWLTGARCLSPPFRNRQTQLQDYLQQLTRNIFARDPRRDHCQPLLLVWKPTQIIHRPKRAEMTQQLRMQGYFDLVLLKCPFSLLKDEQPLNRRIKHLKNGQITLRIHGTPKMQQVVTNGAQVEVVRLMPPQGPAHKINVDITFRGTPEMFIPQKHLTKDYVEAYQTQISFYPSKKAVLGVDPNRISPYLLVFSTEPPELPHSPLSPQLLTMCDRFRALDAVLQALQGARDHAANQHRWRKAHQLTHQYQLTFRRRVNLQQAIHHRCSVELGLHLTLCEAQVLVTEPLSITPKGTRKQLAWATHSMPDDPGIFERAVQNVRRAFQRPCQLHQLPLDRTSLQHVGCLGTLHRQNGHWDWAVCTACGQLVNTHRNAAQRLEVRFQAQSLSALSSDSRSLLPWRPSSHWSASQPSSDG